MIAVLFAALLIQQTDAPVCRLDGDTLELNACEGDALRREEARMRRYLDAALIRAREGDDQSPPGLRTQGEAWLRASQTAWEAYAETRCQGVLDQWKGGSIRTLMYLGCKIEATRQRTHDIWADHLTYADSSPPVLPEPVSEPDVTP